MKSFIFKILICFLCVSVFSAPAAEAGAKRKCKIALVATASVLTLGLGLATLGSHLLRPVYIPRTDPVIQASESDEANGHLYTEHNYFEFGLPSRFAPDSGAVFVGSDKSQFIVPVENLSEDLQAGDIIIYFKPIREDQVDFENLYTRGRWHSGIIGEGEDGKFSIEAPKMKSRASVQDLESENFHVLRPRGLDPEKMQQLNQLLLQLQSIEYDFSMYSSRPTKTAGGVENWVAEVCEGQTFESNCAALVASAYQTIGVELEPAFSPNMFVEQLAYEVEPREAEDQVRKWLQNTRSWGDAGFSSKGQEAFFKSGELPPQAEAIVSAIQQPDYIRQLRFGFEHLTSGTDNQFESMNSPNSLFSEIFGVDGDLLYVGTHIGDENFNSR